MRIGVHIESAGRTPREQLADLADVAARGFAHAWLGQHPTGWDPLAVLAAAGDPGIEVGTAIVMTYPRHPVSLAASAMTVQSLTGGRLTLGVGPSHAWVVRDQLGLSYEAPAAHTREYLTALRPLLRGEPVDYRGEQLSAVTQLDVDAPAPPLLLSALGPVMLRTAGELADGTIALWVRPDTVAEHIVPALTAASRQPPRVVVCAMVVLTADPDGVRGAIADQFAAASTIPAYRAMLRRGGLDSVADTVLAGDERKLTAELARFRDAGTTDLVAMLHGSSTDRARTLDFLAAQHH